MTDRMMAGLNRFMRGSVCVGIAFVVAMTVESSALAQEAVTPSGAGTKASPYQISQLEHLVWMGNHVGSSSGKYYKMQNDIDASATYNSQDWIGGLPPIGRYSSPFQGIFNGNGKVISNLCVERGYVNGSWVGLFGRVGSSGVVKNLGLAGIWVSGDDFVGGLVGQNNGTVRECYAAGVVYGWTILGIRTAESVGGLVGQNNGTVSRCYATAEVRGNAFIGGLVGQNNGAVRDCYAGGSVKGDSDVDAESVGGLVGHNNGTVTGCYATAEVTGCALVGGLVGYNHNTATVSKSYSIGLVRARPGLGTLSGCVGGLVGLNNGTVSRCYARSAVTVEGDFVGGLVGLNGGTVRECYATGFVTQTGGGGWVGGLEGFGGKDINDMSYWDTNTTGQAISASGMGKSTAEMKQQATFSGWDFVHVWRIVGGGYPSFIPLLPVIAVTPGSRDFGSIQVGITTDRTFKVQNIGGGTLSGTASVSAPFYVISGGSYRLDAGQRTTVVVRYHPTSGGDHTETVTFKGGGGAVCQVTGHAPVIAVTPGSRDFGSIQVGTTADRTFKVQNSGGGTLSGTASVSAPFYVISGGSYRLDAGKSTNVVVRYHPTSGGNHTKTVTFTGVGGALRQVTGHAPVISVTPWSRDFGSIQVGTTTDRTFKVQNIGGGTLSGMASGSAPFKVVSGGSYSLDAGKSTNVVVRYHPTSGGNHTNTVTFTGVGGAVRQVTGYAYFALGTGLNATYFDNMDFTRQKGVRMDSTVNVNWGTNALDAAMGPVTFSLLWQGSVEPRSSGTNVFCFPSETAGQVPLDIVTSDDEEGVPSPGWAAVDGDTNTAWIGSADTGGGWMALTYKPALSLGGLNLLLGENSLTNVECLYSLDAETWSDLILALSNGPVDLNYLWLSFPNDSSGTRPVVQEICPE